MSRPEAASAQASSDLGDVPSLPADALPAAEHHCRRAVAHVEGRTARRDLLEALVALLQVAGGPDLGNVARTHLERTGTTVPARCATHRARVRLLAAAVRLHSAADRDVRDRLRSAGLVDRGRESTGSAVGAGSARRTPRAC